MGILNFIFSEEFDKFNFFPFFMERKEKFIRSLALRIDEFNDYDFGLFFKQRSKSIKITKELLNKNEENGIYRSKYFGLVSGFSSNALSIMTVFSPLHIPKAGMKVFAI